MRQQDYNIIVSFNFIFVKKIGQKSVSPEEG